MPRFALRHDRDAGGPADVLAAKAALREEVWSAMRAAKVARFPGAAGRIPNFTGAEAAAQRLRGLPAWEGAATVKSNPDSAQLPVRQRALEDGMTVYMAVPRLAEREPFFALDPDQLDQPPRKAASISGASKSARRVRLDELAPVDLVVMGCVAVGEDGARLGKGGGFADLEYALAVAAGLIGPQTVTVTTVHELQLRPAGTIPLTSHDVPVDFVVTPERVIDARSAALSRPEAGIDWDSLTDAKIAAIPLLSALRAARRTALNHRVSIRPNRGKCQVSTRQAPPADYRNYGRSLTGQQLRKGRLSNLAVKIRLTVRRLSANPRRDR
jgi:5-formyltetrahydrofolate cyclo-ligase